MAFKAGELDENPNGVNLSGEQKSLEYSESAGKKTRGGEKNGSAWYHRGKERKGYH